MLTPRPWGSYETLLLEDRTQVKKIIVEPGQSISLQRHYHRSEHWVVTRGTAEVTQGERTFLLQENESVFIQLGEVHRLFNPGKIALVIVEIQTGSYSSDNEQS